MAYSSQFLPEKPGNTRKVALHSGKKNMGPKLLAIVRKRKKGSKMDKSHPDIVKPDSGLCWFITFFAYLLQNKQANKQTNGGILACLAGGIVWVRD